MCMYADNTILSMPTNQNPAVKIRNWDLTNTGVFCGIGGFAFQAAGTVFTSRIGLFKLERL